MIVAIDMAIFVAYFQEGCDKRRRCSVDQANIAEFKNRLSEFLHRVEQGKSVEICKRNVPIARIVPIGPPQANKTKLGCGRDTIVIEGDVTEPASEWDMLGDDPLI